MELLCSLGFCRARMVGLPVLLSFFVISGHSKTVPIETSGRHTFQIESLFKGSEVIWGFDFLNKDEIIFTEKSGKMKVLNLQTEKTREIAGVPQVWDRGQGGLLDVKVHPSNGWIYFTFSEEQKGKGAGTVLARAKLVKDRLENLERIFISKAVNKERIHFGSRVLFQGDYLFLTLGDRNEREKCQSLSDHNGKVVRLFLDGKVPPDNPFVGQSKALPEIWTLGHRNPQGISENPLTKEIWVGEFGPRGGDELNILKKGANYGWPVVTYGREYYGPSIGEGKEKKGMESPVLHWVPSISFSGIHFYKGDAFPQWKNNLFLANLATQHLRRLSLEGTKATQQDALLKDLYLRFRHVSEGPEGFLYYATDAGVLGRLIPPRISYPAPSEVER